MKIKSQILKEEKHLGQDTIVTILDQDIKQDIGTCRTW